MTYARITAGATIEVHDHRNLLAAWKSYGHTGLVETFKCAKPLTAGQLGRLPAELRARLV